MAKKRAKIMFNARTELLFCFFQPIAFSTFFVAVSVVVAKVSYCILMHIGTV